jgi:hypothetical protein
LAPSVHNTNVVHYWSRQPKGWASGRIQQVFFKLCGRQPKGITEINKATSDFYHNHLTINDQQLIEDQWMGKKLDQVTIHDALAQSASNFSKGDALLGQERFE